MPQRRSRRHREGAATTPTTCHISARPDGRTGIWCPFAVDNGYIVVTMNRRDFLKQHASLEIHPGLVILMPQRPNNRGRHQAELFEKALDAYAAISDDLVNKLMEVRADGSVHIRGWNVDEHDIGH